VLNRFMLLRDQAENLGGEATLDARVVNTLAINRDAGLDGRWNLSLYHGLKVGAARFGEFDATSVVDMAGAEVRYDVTTWLDVGLQSGLRHDWRDGAMAFTAGPSIGVSPVKDVWLGLGWNAVGFSDRDLAEERSTGRGLWLALRIKAAP
jgi:hypothetical protein